MQCGSGSHKAAWCFVVFRVLLPVNPDGSVVASAVVGVPSETPPHTIAIATPLQMADVLAVGEGMLALCTLARDTPQAGGPGVVGGGEAANGLEASASHVPAAGVRAVTLESALNQMQMRDAGSVFDRFTSAGLNLHSHGVSYDTVLHAAALAAQHLSTRDPTAHVADTAGIQQLHHHDKKKPDPQRRPRSRSRGNNAARRPRANSGGRSSSPGTASRWGTVRRHSRAISSDTVISLQSSGQPERPRSNGTNGTAAGGANNGALATSHTPRSVVHRRSLTPAPPSDAVAAPEDVQDQVTEIARLRELVAELQAQARTVAEAVEAGRRSAAIAAAQRDTEVALLLENNEHLVQLLAATQATRMREAWGLLYESPNPKRDV